MLPRLPRVIITAGGLLLSLVLLLITSSLFRLDWIPVLVLAAVLSLGVLAAFRPERALVVVAAFVPVATYLLRRWNPGVAWAETLVVAFAAGWFVRRLLIRTDPVLPAWLRLPLTVFACVVFASLIVQMSVDHARLGTGEFARLMLRYLSREYFVSGSDRYLHAAAFLLEGLLLFDVTARVTALDARLTTRLAGTLAASAAVAAAINLQQLVVSARRFDNFWGTLVQHIATARVNVHYGDLNAAGSVFAMLLLVSGGLAARRNGRVWLVAAAFIGLGLWMSGSRTAMFACPVALAIPGVAAARNQMGTRGRLVTNLICGLLAAAAVAVIYAPTRGNQKASAVAARVRIELARTTLHMVAEDPLFGIGLGEFYQRTGEFSSPELLTLFPPAHHENAHNNFLQVLAETGLIGLGAFLWLLTAVLYIAARPLATSTDDPVAWGIVAGLLAFLLTCVGGHPLLTREAAYAFWIVLGMAAGHASHAYAPAHALERGTKLAAWLKRIAVLMIACLIVSIPFRIASAKAHADFEHLGIGLSPRWETSDDGVRYRSAETSASLFVPGETGFRFRVRAFSSTSERLELRLGGRLVDIVPLVPDRWTDIAMPARSAREDTRFTKLDLRILDAEQRAVTIWISKVEQVGR
jgi:O-antigen ligase